ncbi:pilus assembly PilX family protein [Deinococcus sp. PEB2-67]
MKTAHDRQAGATLIVTVLTMTILIAVLLVVSSQLTITGMRSAGDRRATLQAQYAAESGLEIAKVRLRDTQAIFNGVTNPDGTISPVLEIPRSTKAADLISMAEGYCGKTGSAAWTQTSAAGTYPVKYKCSAAAPAAGDNPNRYKVLAVFARMDRMPPGLAKGRNLKTNTELQTYFSQAFSPTGITTTPAGGNYEVTYRLVPTRVERTGNTNFKFYMQVWAGPKVWTVSSRDSAQEQGTARTLLSGPGDGLATTFAVSCPQRGASGRPLACSANWSGVR